MVKNTKEKIPKMAIYHLSTKPISRSSGRSAVASVAYRAGIEITDERLGKNYNYTKRTGVLCTDLVIPKDIHIQISRNELWNLAEKTETRSNSRTAREIVINIPHELMQGDQSTGKKLAVEFAKNLSQKYGIAVDIAVHAPDKQGDNRNYHAHLLLTTRQITQDKNGRFEFGKKSQLEMSNAQLKKLGLLSNQDELKEIRRTWADLANTYLAEHGLDERIDHRSHADRGLLTLPTMKMGWQATELERKGIKTDVGDHNRAIKAYNEQILENEFLVKFNRDFQHLTKQTLIDELEAYKQTVEIIHDNTKHNTRTHHSELAELFKGFSNNFVARAKEPAQSPNGLFRTADAENAQRPTATHQPRSEQAEQEASSGTNSHSNAISSLSKQFTDCLGAITAKSPRRANRGLRELNKQLTGTIRAGNRLNSQCKIRFGRDKERVWGSFTENDCHNDYITSHIGSLRDATNEPRRANRGLRELNKQLTGTIRQITDGFKQLTTKQNKEVQVKQAEKARLEALLTPQELINRYLQRPISEADSSRIAKFDPCLSDFDHKRTEIENQFKLHEVNGLPLTIDNPVQILLDDVKDLAYLHAKATLLRENAMDDPHLSETLKAMYERLDHPSRLELANGLNNQGNNQQRYTAHALNALKYLQQIENTYQTGIKSEFVEKLSSRQKELTHSNKYLEPLRCQPKQIDQENQNQNIIKPFTPKPF